MLELNKMISPMTRLARFLRIHHFSNIFKTGKYITTVKPATRGHNTCIRGHLSRCLNHIFCEPNCTLTLKCTGLRCVDTF